MIDIIYTIKKTLKKFEVSKKVIKIIEFKKAYII